ncbi:hypothetical protein ACT2CD_00470 [Candidatus Karelsulcia muelleri]
MLDIDTYIEKINNFWATSQELFNKNQTNNQSNKRDKKDVDPQVQDVDYEEVK